MTPTGTLLWDEARRMPDCIRQTAAGLHAQDADVKALMSRARRVVFTGNGASLYAAMGGWLEAVAHPAADGPTPLWCPASLLLDASVHLGADDVVVAVSTSGELRDVVTLLRRPGRPHVIGLTAEPTSSVGREADVVLGLRVLSQRAVTHTQAYASAVTAALHVAALLHGADALDGDELAASCEAALDASTLLLDTEHAVPRSVVCAGVGRAWPAAMQAALMVRELSGIPADGVESREAITSNLAPMGAETTVVVLGADQNAMDEVTSAVTRRGCEVIEFLAAEPGRTCQLELFPPVLALGIALARQTGQDADHPGWYDEYLRVARPRPNGS